MTVLARYTALSGGNIAGNIAVKLPPMRGEMRLLDALS